MITRFLTSVKTRFDPYSPTAKTARIFLSQIGSEARAGIRVHTVVLGRHGKDSPELGVTFNDGKEMNFDLTKMKIQDVVEQVDRHSRLLARKADLAEA